MNVLLPHAKCCIKRNSNFSLTETCTAMVTGPWRHPHIALCHQQYSQTLGCSSFSSVSTNVCDNSPHYVFSIFSSISGMADEPTTYNIPWQIPAINICSTSSWLQHPISTIHSLADNTIHATQYTLHFLTALPTPSTMHSLTALSHIHTTVCVSGSCSPCPHYSLWQLSLMSTLQSVAALSYVHTAVCGSSPCCPHYSQWQLFPMSTLQ